MDQASRTSKQDIGLEDDQLVEIKTTIERESEFYSKMNFAVTATVISMEDEILTNRPSAVLSGFTTAFDFSMPEAFFDHFDSESSHAVDAFELLRKRTKISAFLAAEIPEGLDSVAFIDTIEVPVIWRGRGMALRLLREAHTVLCRPGLLALLRAMPEEDIAGKDGRDLAAYLCSEQQTGLVPIKERTNEPWLVGAWQSTDYDGGDDRVWDPDAHRRSVMRSFLR